MDLFQLGGLLLLAVAVVSACLPRGHRWFAAVGVGGAVVFGIIAWVALEFDDTDEWENAWTVLPLVAISLGGGWALGVGAGYWARHGSSETGSGTRSEPERLRKGRLPRAG